MEHKIPKIIKHTVIDYDQESLDKVTKIYHNLGEVFDNTQSCIAQHFSVLLWFWADRNRLYIH